jgi:hypothetical protein
MNPAIQMENGIFLKTILLSFACLIPIWAISSSSSYLVM